MFSKKCLTWVILAAFLFSTSCTTTRVISRSIEPQPDTLQNELQKGDLVKITTKKGISFELKIADLSSEAIIGSDEILELGQRIPTGGYRAIRQIPFNDIAKIEQLIQETKHDAGKTGILLIGAALVGLIILGSQFEGDFVGELPCFTCNHN